MTAAEMSAAFGSKALSPVDVVRDVIAHIARWEPSLCALWSYEPEAALAA